MVVAQLRAQLLTRSTARVWPCRRLTVSMLLYNAEASVFGFWSLRFAWLDSGDIRVDRLQLLGLPALSYGDALRGGQVRMPHPHGAAFPDGSVHTSLRGQHGARLKLAAMWVRVPHVHHHEGLNLVIVVAAGHHCAPARFIPIASHVVLHGHGAVGRLPSVGFSAPCGAARGRRA